MAFICYILGMLGIEVGLVHTYIAVDLVGILGGEGANLFNDLPLHIDKKLQC